VITKQTANPTAPIQDDLYLSSMARFFGASPADQFFKNYLIQKKKRIQKMPMNKQDYYS